MLYILHGPNTYLRQEALARIKEELGDPQLLSLNTTFLEGASLTLEALEAAGNSFPFLAPKRLVVVEGLLARLAPQRGVPDSAREELARGLLQYLPRLPEFTVLVFLEERLRPNHPLLRALAPQARVQEFPLLSWSELGRWIRSQVQARGGRISPGSVRRLADLVGGDLWTLSQEIEKLCLYAQDREITEEDVQALSCAAREASLYSLVDSVLAGQKNTALWHLRHLLEEGLSPPALLVRLTGQLRSLLLAQDLLARGVPTEEISGRLGLTSPYALRKTVGQARASSPEALKEAYRQLLETDLAIKTGKMEGEIALELQVAELCRAPGLSLQKRA